MLTKVRKSLISQAYIHQPYMFKFPNRSWSLVLLLHIPSYFLLNLHCMFSEWYVMDICFFNVCLQIKRKDTKDLIRSCNWKSL